jgi:UDP:flavonoid glycosyltransferase YjiC (YdhE family)
MSWRYPLYKYFRFLPDAVLDPLTQKGEDLTFRKMHLPFAALRQQHGLLKKQSYAEETQGDLNLICDLPDLFPQRSLPENYLFIPPLQYQPEIETNNVVNKLHPGKRALFASMGSTGDWSALNFLNEPQFQQYNIITAGDSAGVVQGQNVIRMPFVAAEPLFRHIDLVLCHGGNGTVYQALQYGIPLLCKTAHFEQEWNVQALQKNGLGTSLDHVKSGREALKLVDAWSRKRGTMPFLTIQEKLGDAAALWESVSMRIAAFAPAVEKRLLYTPERKTA